MAPTSDDTFRILRRREFAYIIKCMSKYSNVTINTIISSWATCAQATHMELPEIQEWFRKLLEESGWTLAEFVQECSRQNYE